MTLAVLPRFVSIYVGKISGMCGTALAPDMGEFIKVAGILGGLSFCICFNL